MQALNHDAGRQRLLDAAALVQIHGARHACLGRRMPETSRASVMRPCRGLAVMLMCRPRSSSCGWWSLVMRRVERHRGNGHAQAGIGAEDEVADAGSGSGRMPRL